MITIKVLNVKGHRPMLQARGYLPGGSEFIRGCIRDGHDPLSQAVAVKEVADWIRKNRPGWDIATNSAAVEEP